MNHYSTRLLSATPFRFPKYKVTSTDSPMYIETFRQRVHLEAIFWLRFEDG